MTDFLYRHLDIAIAAYVPSFHITKSTYPSWFSKELISLIKAKKSAHLKYKCTNLFSDYLTFSLRTGCKSLSTTCWSNFIDGAERALPSNANLFWSFVRRVKSSEPRISRILHDGHLLEDNESIANCFADYFESVYTGCDGLVDNPNNVFKLMHSLDLLSLDISIEEVYNEIDKLSLNCAVGMDSIPPLF